VSAHTAQ